MGRPSSYTQEIGDKICERIATSELGMEEVLEEIRATDGWAPGLMTVWRWCEANQAFREQSVRARKMQAELLHDRAQRYAREALIGLVRTVERDDEGKETITERTVDNVERSKLLVQTTLRRAGQLDGKKYGDKVQHANADGDGPAELIVRLADAIGAARKRRELARGGEK
jgi:hypothetical protein